ncbi:por secretion system C-terminal sorting domain, partial [Bacteroidales bacterium 6E]
MSGFFTYIINGLRGQKKISDGRLVCQYSANDTKYIECSPAQLTVMFDDSHETVCDNRNVNLYSHSVFRITPERCDAEMLLYPPKKEFHLPALLIQHSDVFRLDADVVGQERERSFKVGSIVNDPPHYAGIFLPGLVAR